MMIYFVGGSIIFCVCVYYSTHIYTFLCPWPFSSCATLDFERYLSQTPFYYRSTVCGKSVLNWLCRSLLANKSIIQCFVVINWIICLAHNFLSLKLSRVFWKSIVSTHSGPVRISQNELSFHMNSSRREGQNRREEERRDQNQAPGRERSLCQNLRARMFYCTRLHDNRPFYFYCIQNGPRLKRVRGGNISQRPNEVNIKWIHKDGHY